jgi:hypothetical protein
MMKTKQIITILCLLISVNTFAQVPEARTPDPVPAAQPEAQPPAAGRTNTTQQRDATAPLPENPVQDKPSFSQIDIEIGTILSIKMPNWDDYIGLGLSLKSYFRPALGFNFDLRLPLMARLNNSTPKTKNTETRDFNLNVGPLFNFGNKTMALTITPNMAFVFTSERGYIGGNLQILARVFFGYAFFQAGISGSMFVTMSGGSRQTWNLVSAPITIGYSF